jgi:4a-hydroxytetrahydrobiopterin dehydratase
MDLKFFKNNISALEASFKFIDFKEAFIFMTEVAVVAESMNHHPEWKNVYNTVEITLRTHDANNTVTDKDYSLASAIEVIIVKYKLKI